MKRSPLRLPDQSWFSIVQLAQLLKINRQHLRHLVEEGQFSHAVDLRSKGSPRACVRVSREAVLEFIEERDLVPQKRYRMRRQRFARARGHLVP
jgi:Helix-turn-helix domain